MLNAVEDIARTAGFDVISETATPGFLERITQTHIPARLPKKRRKVRSVSITPTPAGGMNSSNRHSRDRFCEPWSNNSPSITGC